MAEEWLEEIYVHSRYVTELKEIRQLCLLDNKPDALRHWEASCDHLLEVSKNPVADVQVQMRLQKIFTMTSQVSDCEKLIDLIQTEILPMMYYLISLYGKIDVSDGGYRILSSKAGYLVLFDEERGRYRHSIVDPMEEAFDIAQKNYSPKNTEYHIWGGELGYLAYQIYQMSHQSARLHLYEADQTMLEYGIHYGVLDWIAEEKLVLHLDPGAEEFLQNVNREKRNFVISRSDPYYEKLVAALA